jgi:hypothetical protein
MLNTFKPFWKWYKRQRHTHDWFGIHLIFCNEIRFAITVFGYGFSCGALIYDVMKSHLELKSHSDRGEEEKTFK